MSTVLEEKIGTTIEYVDISVLVQFFDKILKRTESAKLNKCKIPFVENVMFMF